MQETRSVQNQRCNGSRLGFFMLVAALTISAPAGAEGAAPFREGEAKASGEAEPVVDRLSADHFVAPESDLAIRAFFFF